MCREDALECHCDNLAFGPQVPNDAAHRTGPAVTWTILEATDASEKLTFCVTHYFG